MTERFADPTWPPWLFDIWGAASQGRAARQAAIDAQQERYRRAEAFRAGNLDEYDAIHHPERLAERQRKGFEPLTARDLGVTSAPRSPNASYPKDPT